MKTTALFTTGFFALFTSIANAQAIEPVDTRIGTVLAAAKNGMTLYTFRKDSANTSNCYDSCAKSWPPFLASSSAKAEGALTLVERKDGSQQWALEGQPLYFWVGDKKRGDATGEGIGGVWDAAKN